jgi:Putative MetA-pathway of phenol degradation
MMIASSVNAEERDLCVDRPGLATPACTIDSGRVMVEIGLADWSLDRQPDTRTDTIMFGDVLVRIGIDRVTEGQIGWAGYGHVRSRDVASGLVTRSSGVGDVTLGIKRSLSGSNGPAAIQGFVTVPVGGNTAGSGDWGAGVLLPLEIDLGSGLSLGLTPEIDAAVDQDRSGRHLAYGSVAGISAAVTKKLSTDVELSAFRDNDPDGHVTTRLASISFGYQANDDTQYDFGAVKGLDSASPDIEIYFGISRRF